MAPYAVITVLVHIILSIVLSVDDSVLEYEQQQIGNVMFEIKFNNYNYADIESFIVEKHEEASPMILTLYWKQYIYDCTIYPNKTSMTHKCIPHQNTIISLNPSIINRDSVKIEILFNSPKRIVIDSISIHPGLIRTIYYKITHFCVPKQYDYLQSHITMRRGNKCTNSKYKDYEYVSRQYMNLCIGQDSYIIHQTFELPSNFRESPTNIEALVLPSSIKEISIHVAKPYQIYNNPQTKFPVTLSLYWYDKFYQCIIHPINKNTEYKCIIDTEGVEMCAINSTYFGEYALLIEKHPYNDDGLNMDKITITDITGTFYIINHFCIHPDDQHSAAICLYDTMNDTCHGYIGTASKNAEQFIDCNATFIDRDTPGGGSNRLFYYFVNNLYLYNNASMQAVVYTDINRPTHSCPVALEVNVNNDNNLYLNSNNSDVYDNDINNTHSNGTDIQNYNANGRFHKGGMIEVKRQNIISSVDVNNILIFEFYLKIRSVNVTWTNILHIGHRAEKRYGTIELYPATTTLVFSMSTSHVAADIVKANISISLNDIHFIQCIVTQTDILIKINGSVVADKPYDSHLIATNIPIQACHDIHCADVDVYNLTVISTNNTNITLQYYENYEIQQNIKNISLHYDPNSVFLSTNTSTKEIEDNILALWTVIGSIWITIIMIVAYVCYSRSGSIDYEDGDEFDEDDDDDDDDNNGDDGDDPTELSYKYSQESHSSNII